MVRRGEWTAEFAACCFAQLAAKLCANPSVWNCGAVGAHARDVPSTWGHPRRNGSLWNL